MAGPSESAPGATPARRPWLGFAVWLAAGPILALVWLALSYRHMPPGGFSSGRILDTLFNGLDMLLLAAVMSVVALLAALIHGALTRSLLHCLLGFGIGVPLGLMTLVHVHEAIQNRHLARKTAVIEAEHGRFAALIDIVDDRGQDRIERALHALPAQWPMPRAMCALGGGDEQDFDRWVFRTPDGSKREAGALGLISAASAVVYGDWPREQKQAALYAVLASFARHDNPDLLGEWIDLWRRTQADPAAPRLVFDTPRYRFTGGDCRGGDDIALARLLLGIDDNAGLDVWLKSGYGFAPGQTAAALAAVRDPASLHRLREAGVDARGELLAEPGGAALFGEIVSATTRALDRGADPARPAELIEAYVGLGADPRRETAPGATACVVFERNERLRAERLARGHGARAPADADARLDDDRDPPAPDTPQRKGAAARIRAALCPAGAVAATGANAARAHAASRKQRTAR